MLVLCLVDKALICCSGFMKGRTKFVRDVILVNLFELFCCKLKYCCKLWGFILFICEFDMCLVRG